ncbi:interactor of constitutive active ROPs 4-like [Nicotiana tomentosiformis]|uniref:interactor of constitutive active ROPs 4-like n=1 Tax=Nicotiana tomentosiformis TaxID=4098 RepID=UPI00388CE870
MTTKRITGLGDLEILRKSPSLRASRPSSSPKLFNRFPAPSVDLGRKRSITISLSEDAQVISALVGVARYLRYLVTEDDQAKMNEVDAPYLFNKAQEALNRASREGEAKSLRAELEVAQKEHADLVEQVKIFEIIDEDLGSVTNGRNPQVQQKIDQIDQLRAEMDAVKAKTDEWSGRMDRLSSEREVSWAKLTLAEVQLRAAKGKVEVHARKVEELQSRLSSVASDREIMAKELETAKSAAVVAKADADKMVAQYKADAEAAQDRLKDTVEYEKR